MEHTIWNAVLSIGISVAGFFLKSVFDEVKRLQVLINKTREEIAKEYVTKTQLDADINRIFDRLDRLESKIDRLMEQHK
jgi:regulator of replication initiation timing